MVQYKTVSKAAMHQILQNHLDQSPALCFQRKKRSGAAESPDPSSTQRRAKQRKRLRRREKEVLTCEMCQARVRRAQMGKHLLSHYHCRVAGANPSGPRARRFLLDNMANIVRQCPFQCAPCRFYCNTGETFLRHWRSEPHKETVAEVSLLAAAALVPARAFAYTCTPWRARQIDDTSPARITPLLYSDGVRRATEERASA